MPTVKVLGVSHSYTLTEPALAEPLSRELISSDQALVFIHGWLLSRAYWQPLVSQLSAHHRCLTYDLRGFGESTQGSNGNQQSHASKTLPCRQLKMPTGYSWMPSDSASAYSLAAYAQDLSELLDRLGLDRAWLLGHSLGGSIALWAAYLLPERIKGVICINAGGGIYIPKEFEKFRAAGQQMVKYRPAWLPAVPLLPRLFSRLMVYQPLDPCWGRQRIDDFIRADEQAAAGALLESTTCEAVHQLPQLVAQLKQPVHFITASEDRVMPPRYVHYLASFHSHFQAGMSVSELTDCGHMAMVEQPGAVGKVVRAILENGSRQ